MTDDKIVEIADNIIDKLDRRADIPNEQIFQKEIKTIIVRELINFYTNEKLDDLVSLENFIFWMKQLTEKDIKEVIYKNKNYVFEILSSKTLNNSISHLIYQLYYTE